MQVEGNVAGEEQDTGSQVTGSEGNTGGQEPPQGGEPMVEFDGQQVPVSVLKRALKNDERFTKEAQEAARKRDELSEREGRLLQREMELGGVAEILKSPEGRTKLTEAGFTIPTGNEPEVARVLAENIGYKFRDFSNSHPELNDTMLEGVMDEAKRLGRSGRTNDALDFESIAYRLYHKEVLEAERKKAVADAEKEAKAKAKQAAAASTAGMGTAQIPSDVDVSKLTAAQKMSLGHRMAEAARAKRSTSR